MHRVTSFSNVKTNTEVCALFGRRESGDSWKIKMKICISENEKKWRSAILNSSINQMSNLLSNTPKLVNWKDYITGNTALHFAAKDNEMAMILLLVGTYKADVECKNHGGLTPLHMAAMGGSEEAAFSLLSRFNANCFARDYSGHLPSTYLPRTSKGESMKRLFKDEVQSILIEHPLMEYVRISANRMMPPVARHRLNRNDAAAQKLTSDSESTSSPAAVTLDSCNSSFRRSHFGRKSLRSSSKQDSNSKYTSKSANSMKNADIAQRHSAAYLNMGVLTYAENEQIEIRKEKCLNRLSVQPQQEVNNNNLVDTINSTVRSKKEKLLYKFNPLTQRSTNKQDNPDIAETDFVAKPVRQRGSLFSLEFSPQKSPSFDQ